MYKLITIPDWERNHETSDTRRVARTKYYVSPIRFDGRRMRALQKLDDALGLYGAFQLICDIASDCPIRGVLLDSRGPLTPQDIVDVAGIEEESGFIAKAIEALSQPAVGILRIYDIEKSADGVWRIPPVAISGVAPKACLRRQHLSRTGLRVTF